KISEVPVTVVRFTDSCLRDPWGEIREVGEELQRLVEEGRNHLLLNFCDVEFMSSAMLGVLQILRKKLLASNGTLTLTNIRPDIFPLFTIPKLDKLFDIRDEQAGALPSI